MDFLVVIMASGIARGREARRRRSRSRWQPANRLTKTYSLGLQRTSWILDIHIMVN